MYRNLFEKYRKFLITMLIFNFIFVSSAFGQTVEKEEENDESEIFPFAEVAVETPDEERTIDYSEDLIEVTDTAVYDSEGNVIESSASEGDGIYVDESDLMELGDVEVESDAQSAFEAYRDSIIANWGGKLEFTKRRLDDIKKNLDEELENFNRLDEEIVEIEDKMEPVRQEIENLKGQIELLNSQLAISKKKIQNTELLIAEKKIALKDLMWDLKKSQVQFDIQKEVVLDYISLVYQEEEKYLDYFADNSSSTLKLLLADNSVSENLLGYEYSKILEETGRKVFYDLYNQKKELGEKLLKVQGENYKIDQLYSSLDQERRLLEQGKIAKRDLLEKTKGEEDLYQKLLDESIKQQLESAIAIQNLKDNIDFIESKLEVLDESLQKVESMGDPDEDEEVSDIVSEVDELDDEIDEDFAPEPDEDIIPKFQPFIWPVPPKAVTAYFHDPSYPKRWGIHNAVDIRAKQYTEIRAPANAYVFQTKDNGMGYSYIILAHKNKLITVYGHVTKIIAKPGTVVKQGDLIGLTGGTPGTKGAGWQTTGPHLHFEVWHNGEQVDPLDWLPVFDLPIEYIPDRYLTAE